jgi:hypothetical protein
MHSVLLTEGSVLDPYRDILELTTLITTDGPRLLKSQWAAYLLSKLLISVQLVCTVLHNGNKIILFCISF